MPPSSAASSLLVSPPYIHQLSLFLLLLHLEFVFRRCARRHPPHFFTPINFKRTSPCGFLSQSPPPRPSSSSSCDSPPFSMRTRLGTGPLDFPLPPACLPHPLPPQLFRCPPLVFVFYPAGLYPHNPPSLERAPPVPLHTSSSPFFPPLFPPPFRSCARRRARHLLAIPPPAAAGWSYWPRAPPAPLSPPPRISFLLLVAGLSVRKLARDRFSPGPTPPPFIPSFRGKSRV